MPVASFLRRNATRKACGTYRAPVAPGSSRRSVVPASRDRPHRTRVFAAIGPARRASAGHSPPAPFLGRRLGRRLGAAAQELVRPEPARRVRERRPDGVPVLRRPAGPPVGRGTTWLGGGVGGESSSSLILAPRRKAPMITATTSPTDAWASPVCQTAAAFVKGAEPDAHTLMSRPRGREGAGPSRAYPGGRRSSCGRHLGSAASSTFRVE